jgi:hypothetical protein
MIITSQFRLALATETMPTKRMVFGILDMTNWPRSDRGDPRASSVRLDYYRTSYGAPVCLAHLHRHTSTSTPWNRNRSVFSTETQKTSLPDTRDSKLERRTRLGRLEGYLAGKSHGNDHRSDLGDIVGMNGDWMGTGKMDHLLTLVTSQQPLRPSKEPQPIR